MSEETTELTWRRGWCGHARKLCKWKARSYGSSERSPAGEGISVTGGATPSLIMVAASVLALKRPPRD